jgi:hypothetical protein
VTNTPGNYNSTMVVNTAEKRLQIETIPGILKKVEKSFLDKACKILNSKDQALERP